MDDEHFTNEQELRDIYYNPKTGYQSMDRLYQKAKTNGLDVTRKQVREWLKSQDTYTRFKPIVRKHKFAKTYVNDLAEQVQLDLVDMGKYKKDNDNYYWILTGIEILSRYAFALPVYRKNTENMVEAVSKFLEQFKKRFDKYPKVVQFDDGKEFYNVGVKTLLEKHNIEYFSTNSERKAAIVERFNRTLKTQMRKYFYANDTHRWVHILDELTYNYNHAKHRTILMKPADVNESNSFEVWTTLFGYNYGEFPVPKFKIGDQVRISRYKNTFAKGYEASFTEEIFKVVAVFRGDPNMYEVEDHDHEKIIGKFYEQELSAVDKKDDVYKVEKILRKKKGMVLVKWLGYGDKHNSWIPEKNIVTK